MHASVDVHLELTIQDAKTVPLATLAQSITDLDIEARLVEEFVESAVGQLTESYCGDKYERGNGEKRYQRGGTTIRTATTTAGEHELTLHQVKDTTEGTYFRPVEDAVTFDGKNHYQADVSGRRRAGYQDELSRCGNGRRVVHRDAVSLEGTFKNLFSLLMEIAPDPATERIVKLAYRDEARHVAYGVNRLNNQLEQADDPDELGEEFVEALERRLMMAYEVSGIPANVQEALAIVAGGGEKSSQVEAGEERVVEFIEELNRDRKDRLLQSGFSEAIAEEISDLHVRSSGGLM